MNKENTIFILGNGPSLADVMGNSEKLNILKQYHTFGFNAAYRKFDELNFYPTYFGCCDPKLIKTHLKEFKNLLHNSPIKKCFFVNQIQKDPNPPFTKEDTEQETYQKIKYRYPTKLDPRGKGRDYTEEVFVKNLLNSTFDDFYNIPSTGAASVSMAIIMGYKNIILLGCDCSYTEFIKESKVSDAEIEELIITKTPEKNENYWFDDYQQKGDLYTVPSGGHNHRIAWELAKKMSDYHNVRLVNCSQISKIECIPKSTFEKEIELLLSTKKN
tara:strand:- start:396 stop:1211 length:816 start_codon:yes stop_codon:yes gene_type:complete